MMSQFACVLLLLIYYVVAQGTDVPSLLPRDESNAPLRRTTFNIAWGCISTTIICTWAAMHPDIPSPRESSFRATIRKLRTVYWAIMIPEAIPSWALNQHLMARKVRDVYNKRGEKRVEPEGRRGCCLSRAMTTRDVKTRDVKEWFSLPQIIKNAMVWFWWYGLEEDENEEWTMTHGFFLIMGGFHLVEPANTSSDVPSTSAPLATNADLEKGHDRSENLTKHERRETLLTLELLQELVKEPAFKIRITEGDIKRMAKGDGLSKTILTLQAAWFIAQCIARVWKRLHLTHLELTTLALASLNGITYILWFYKPLGTETVFRIHMERKLTEGERKLIAESTSDHHKQFHGIQDIYEAVIQTVSGMSNWWIAIALPLAIPLFLFSPLLLLALDICLVVYDFTAGPHFLPKNATHTSAFYSPLPDHRRFRNFFYVTLSLLFGGIHCFVWYSPFPTILQQTSWRVASLMVTLLPVLAFVYTVVFNYSRDTPFDPYFPAKDIVHRWAIILIMSVYALARYALVALAFSLLWNLPHSSFVALNWNFPHIS